MKLVELAKIPFQNTAMSSSMSCLDLSDKKMSDAFAVNGRCCNHLVRTVEGVNFIDNLARAGDVALEQIACSRSGKIILVTTQPFLPDPSAFDVGRMKSILFFMGKEGTDKTFNNRIKKHLSKRCDNLNDAMSIAVSIAENGDNIVLMPLTSLRWSESTITAFSEIFYELVWRL